MKKNQEKVRLYTDMSFKWRDFRLQERDHVDEVIDKRALAWLVDAFVIALIGDHKIGINKITKMQDIVRKYVSPENFNKAHNILNEELSMAMRRAMVKIENL